MRCRFIHAADIHLGYEQYNLAQRADDFARAYLAMVEHAIDVRADFVLIAGDLFHKANTDAWTLKQATTGLQWLRQAGVPVVAVEGNHDAQHYHKHLSWLEFLCDQDLLTLLNLNQATNRVMSLGPFDPDQRRGSWIEIAGARIYGMKYYGAATARMLEQIEGQIEPGAYTIMMLHAGLEGQVPHLHGGLTPGQLGTLRPHVDYLALGHVHKQLCERDWIYNPGSTEINSFEEIDWPHGFFDVQVDTEQPDKHTVQAVATNTRHFHRITVTADRIRSADDFVERVESRIASESDIPDKAVIELHLGGVAEFKRQDVPLERLKSAVHLRFNPLTVRVRNNLVPPGIVRESNRERLSRSALERQVVEHLVYQHAEYRDQAAAWARLILDVKNMAAEGEIPASIADHVRESLSRRLSAPDEAGDAEAEPVDALVDVNTES